MKQPFPNNPTPTGRPDDYYLFVHKKTDSIIAAAIMNPLAADRINRLGHVRFRQLVWIHSADLPKHYRWQVDTHCPQDLLQQLSSRK